MSFDDWIHEALERTTAGLKAQLERDLAVFTDELRRAAVEERDRSAARVAEEIKGAVQAQVSDIRNALQAQLDEARRAAEAEADEARQAAQVEIDAVRRAADAQVGELRRHAENQLEDARRALEERVADVQSRAGVDVEAARAEAAAARAELVKARAEAAAARAELDKTHAERETARLEMELARTEAASLRVELVEARAEAERLRADAETAVRAQAGGAEKRIQEADLLAEALRAIDGAHGLGETLDVLADRAARYAERTAVLVVNGGGLRGRRLVGFPGQNPVPRVSVDLDAAGIAGAAVIQGVTVTQSHAAPNREGPALPSFAENAGPRHAVALPLLVGGRVVAVLYADAPAETPASEWPAALDVLARHASLALEAMTIRQATGLARAATRAPAAAGSGGPASAGGQDAPGDEDAARRYARLLVSEIRMDHEPVVDEGRRSRDLRARLGGEIDRARRLYEARVPPALRERSDYFEQELVRTLADGDRSLLG